MQARLHQYARETVGYHSHHSTAGQLLFRTSVNAFDMQQPKLDKQLRRERDRDREITTDYTSHREGVWASCGSVYAKDPSNLRQSNSLRPFSETERERRGGCSVGRGRRIDPSEHEGRSFARASS